MIAAERTIEDNRHDVTVTITGDTAESLLFGLAAAARWDTATRAELDVLLTNQSLDGARRVLAVRTLLNTADIRRALTLTITPEEAEKLHDELDEAGLEPQRCTESCDNYALPGDGGMCPRHAQDEDAHAVWGRRAL